MAKNQTATVTVDSLIIEAGNAAGTMYNKAREAAKLAASELRASLPLAERLAEVIGNHKAAFATAGHNVKAIFTDALTLLACGTDDVLTPVLGEKGKKVDAPVKAADAVELAKNTMRDAARQVREIHGIGRKAGGGRKAPAKVEAAKLSDSEMLAGTLGDLAEMLKVPGNVQKLKTFFNVHGFVLQEKATTLAKTMATLPTRSIKGTATVDA